MGHEMSRSGSDLFLNMAGNILTDQLDGHDDDMSMETLWSLYLFLGALRDMRVLECFFLGRQGPLLASA